MPSDVFQRMTRGAAWMVLFKLIERSIGLVSTLILVRLLLPEDFGIVAMAMSFIFVGELLAAFGFDIALIQNRAATVRHYNTAWTLNVAMGGCIAVIMLALAWPASAFYREPSLALVIAALAFGPLLGAFENIGVVAFRKDLDFRKEFYFQLSRKLVGFCIVVPLAFIFRNYWALVAGTLASKLAGTLLSYWLHPFRPRFSLQEASSLFGFSRWLLINNVFGLIKERSSDFIVGRLQGAASLGLYNVSYEISSLPTTELSGPINRALIPGFAQLASEGRAALRPAYLRATELLALLSLPAALGLQAIAPLLVPVALGHRWLSAVNLIEVLALNGIWVVFQAQASSALVAVGRPSTVTRINAIYVLFLVPLMAWQVSERGALGAAFVVVSLALAASPAYLAALRRHLGIAPMEVLSVLLRPALSAVVMLAAVRYLMPAEPASLPTATGVGALIALVGLGALVYTVMLVLLWLLAGRPDGAERWVLTRAGRFLGHRGSLRS